MAIAHSNSVASSTTAAATIGINPGASLHDVIIAAYVSDSAFSSITTPPTGFSAVDALTTTLDGMSYESYIKGDATGSEGTLNASVSADAIVGVMTSFSGVDNTTPEDVTHVSGTANTSVASLNAPSITPLTAGAKLVCILAMDAASSANATFSTSSGSTGAWTKHVEIIDTTGFRKVAIGSADWISGAIVVNGACSVNGALAITVMVLRPAAGGGGGNLSFDEGIWQPLEMQTNPLNVSMW